MIRIWTAAIAAHLVALAGLLTPALAVSPLVSVEWLSENHQDENVIVLDTRSKISNSGREDYLKAHIPGAVWSEYPGYWRTERDGVVGVLPSIEKLEAALSDIGVAEEKTVVLVPAGSSSLEFGAATRIYWTLKYLGHEDVAILDGGHAAWVNAGLPLESGNVVPEGDLFIAEPNDALLVSTSEVAGNLGGSSILLDGRPTDQFAGLKKHKKAVRPGRLPGATSLDQALFYDAAGNALKPQDALTKVASAALPDKNADIISYCNTGHWAATNWFVLSELLGYENVKVYDASMVGWSLDPELPMEADNVSALKTN